MSERSRSGSPAPARSRSRSHSRERDRDVPPPREESNGGADSEPNKLFIGNLSFNVSKSVL